MMTVLHNVFIDEQRRKRVEARHADVLVQLSDDVEPHLPLLGRRRHVVGELHQHIGVACLDAFAALLIAGALAALRPVAHAGFAESG
jgi:hypothetical protein